MPLRPLRCALVGCGDGAMVRESDEMPARIAQQLVAPVAFRDALRALVAEGATDLVTLGPGRVPRALVRANLGTAVRLHLAFDSDDCAAIATARSPSSRAATDEQAHG